MPFHRGRRRALTATAGVLTLLTAPLVSGTAAAVPSPGFAVTRVLTPSSTVAVPKASSRVARTDPALLTLTGSASTPVLVKLDVDALATYPGDANGQGATSPSVTGRKLDRRRPEVREHEARIAAVEQGFRRDLARAVPSGQVGRSFRAVYGGVAVRLPADRIAALAALPSVVAVQPDPLNQLLAVGDEARFIGAPAVYDALGSDRTAGRGVLIADLDTGVWPEHPSFAARPDLPPALTRPDGTALPCTFGDDPLTPGRTPFRCNNKLVSGQDFLQTYSAVIGDQAYAGTARDDDGHGTHTSSTAGGNPLASAVLFGIDRGPVQGIAPGAQIAAYRVCGPAGCFGSDLTAAVEQAVLDGADVLNYSISGGTSPFTDATELAFLDAYAAGVFVSASAGNSGPAAGSTDHLAPWVTTVAASTQSRAFVSALTLTSAGRTVRVEGASIMNGVGTHPVVRAESAQGQDALCSNRAKRGVYAGKIVICVRGGNARVAKSQNVRAGGAVGMILENPVVQDVETDNHFVPTVHLDAPAASKIDRFLAAHPGATGTFTAGTRASGRGDVMAAFSSRGPAGGFLKPDVTSTGVQVLAGNSPTPGPDSVGGTLFQAIAGTSMSAPHVTGAGALIKALHPTWTPGQIRSALATTARQAVLKEDGRTPADPFDYGSGRVDLASAGEPGLTFDATPTSMAALAANPKRQVDLNVPSIYDAAVPGRIRTYRTARNVTSGPLTVEASTRVGSGARLSVTPSRVTVPAGSSVTFRVVVDASGVDVGTTVFGQIDLTSASTSPLHLPVVFTRAPEELAVSTSCARSELTTGASTTCGVDVENTALTAASVTSTTRVTHALALTAAGAPATLSAGRVEASGRLAARRPDAPRVRPGASPSGFRDLGGFGVTPTPIGDEAVQNYDVPAFTYHGQRYTSVGVTSNGYLVVGGAGAADVHFLPQQLPDPAAPNNVLAPFWSDLDGTGRPGISVAALSAGPGQDYLVVQADQRIFGTASTVRYQVWLGLNGAEDISFVYDGRRPIVPDADTPFVVGAENADGTAGESLPGLPAGDLVVRSTPGAPGGVLHYTVRVAATGRPGSSGEVVTGVRAPRITRGTTNATATIDITR